MIIAPDVVNLDTELEKATKLFETILNIENTSKALNFLTILSGGALLIYGIIYEDVLVAIEDGLIEHIKKALRCRKHQQRKRK